MIYERRMATRVPPNAVAADAIDARRVHTDLVLLDEILFSWCWFHADAKAPMPVRRRLDDRDEARISVERLRGSGGSISRRSSSYLRVVPYNWTWCDDLHSYLSELKLKPENGFPAFLSVETQDVWRLLRGATTDSSNSRATTSRKSGKALPQSS